MWSEYELTRTAAQELRDDSLVSVPEMKNQITERKNRIRALGNVNVNAIEDYRELSERYEFMKTQHQDLVTAQEALYQIIEELDTGMRRQFTERFAPVSYTHLDEMDREILPGMAETGELCIRGDAVGPGYYRDPEQTARKFIQNPLEPAAREMIYRTGDLVRYGTDGLLEFCGRAEDVYKRQSLQRSRKAPWTTGPSAAVW